MKRTGIHRSTVGTPRKARSELKRSGALKRDTAIRKVNRARRASEFARCYGSKERVEWVKEQRCAVGFCSSPAENVHIEGDGASRKAGYELIVPLCHTHHLKLHAYGRGTFEEGYGLDLAALAAETQQRWEAHCAETT